MNTYFFPLPDDLLSLVLVTLFALLFDLPAWLLFLSTLVERETAALVFPEELRLLTVAERDWLLVTGLVVSVRVADLVWLLVTGLVVSVRVADLSWLLVTGLVVSVRVADLSWLLVTGLVVSVRVADLSWLLVTGLVVSVRVA
ncbi:MAG: hypothetical protein V2I34_10450, partial [Bacteroidales bacterium]|nr:hypothetical protein [Bacteroidales bacterium]